MSDLDYSVAYLDIDVSLGAFKTAYADIAESGALAAIDRVIRRVERITKRGAIRASERRYRGRVRRAAQRVLRKRHRFNRAPVAMADVVRAVRAAWDGEA